MKPQHTSRTRARRAALLVLSTCAVILVAWVLLTQRDRLPRHYLVNTNSLDEWTAFGGDWQANDGVVTNRSNESGSRLLAGSASLQDYSVDTDVRLTNSYGDAGVVFRVSDSEEGTNAFYGYYAAMRQPNMLVLARMDYGFQPLRIVTLSQPVTAGVWYHLAIQARGCALAVQARTADGILLGSTSTTDTAECQARGRFGLRSFAAGGSWRKVDVQPLR